jgi:hypothetical protein
MKLSVSTVSSLADISATVEVYRRFADLLDTGKRWMYGI